jgi:hypothetical protein
MSETLADIQRRLAGSRGRLEDWTRRLAALRARVTGAEVVTATATATASASASAQPAAPLFPPEDGTGRSSIADLELEFQALNGDQPERKGR